jgi:sugar transferase (PEP-CTERM/EpsH1 system associated)
MALFRSRKMSAYVQELSRRVPLAATVAYALPMVPHAPWDVPMLLDMQDVDSEKWFQYARMRRLGFLYEIEARRLRAQELRCVGQAVATYLTARQETALLRSLAPTSAVVECMENGVDYDYFHPDRIPGAPDLAGRLFIAFVGTMNYYPNVDAACWFAREVYPEIRRRQPSLEFLVVGNHPAKAVWELARLPGVRVTGGVPDVRPYLAGARALVTPLRLARGIQNKVLEGLALGRQVCATAAVCNTFGEEVPPGVIRCDSPAQFADAVLACAAREPRCDPDIRDHTRRRFSWRRNLEPLVNTLDVITEAMPVTS